MFSSESLNSDEFSWDAALSLVLSSQLAYADESKVNNVATGDWGLDEAKFISFGDTQLFVARNSRIVVVAFRGTESLRDWLTDLDARSTDRPYGAIHNGFYNAYQVVSRPLTGFLGSGDLGGRKLWITGHSLGGALAVIAAAEFVGKYPVTGLHTFGQPRVGFAEFQTFMNGNFADNFFRFVNDDDIVPRVPPFYRHAGKLMHFDASGDLQAARVLTTRDAATTEPPPLSEAEFEQLKAQIEELEATARRLEAAGPAAARDLAPADVEIVERGLFPSVRDHSLARYIAAVQGYADNPDREHTHRDVAGVDGTFDGFKGSSS